MNPRTAMSEESRLQVAVVAGATERSNRPRFMLILAGLLLLGAAGYAGVQAQALGAARAQVRSQENRAQQINALVAELRAAHAQQQLDALPRDVQTTDKLQRLGRYLGLPETLAINERGESAGAAGFTNRIYSANFTAPDAGAVLEWLVAATGENTFGISGVQVRSVRLRPQHNNSAGGWAVEVVLSRIERGS